MGVATPVWFGEEGDKLYVMTRSDSGKLKRIRNNPRIEVAPCSFRGKISGPKFPAHARLLQSQDFGFARHTLNGKYWMARIPFLWRHSNVYLEITFDGLADFGLTSHG